MGIEIAWFQAVERCEKAGLRHGEMRLGKTVGIMSKLDFSELLFKIKIPNSRDIGYFYVV